MEDSPIHFNNIRVILEQGVWCVEENINGNWCYLNHFESKETALHWISFAVPKQIIDTRASD